MREPLANPERNWKVTAKQCEVTSQDIEARLGATPRQWQVLSGGLANSNVLVDGRVLRIYRRDPGALLLEAALLRRPWQSFRVPGILEVGSDFMLLEYVPHGPLRGSAEHGVAVGVALAEIHALSFEQAGFLSSELQVAQPFPDLVPSLIGYLRSLVPIAEAALGAERARRVLDVLESNVAALSVAAGKPVLLHADFKASNLHWSDDNRLLVLDWEFAYAGSRLSDVGQLLRWAPPDLFVTAFAAGYEEGGAALPAGFSKWAELLDLVNLVGLVANRSEIAPEPRIRDVSARIDRTLSNDGRSSSP